MQSTHAFEYMWPIAQCKKIRNPDSGKFLPVESGILGFGIWNVAQSVQNLTKDWNPESQFHRRRKRDPVPGIRNPWRGIQSPRLSWIPLHVHGTSTKSNYVIRQFSRAWQIWHLTVFRGMQPIALKRKLFRNFVYCVYELITNNFRLINIHSFKWVWWWKISVRRILRFQ